MYKSLSHDVKEADKTKGIITAYANVYNFKDSDGDISLPGSFTKAVETGFKRIRVLKDHDRYTSLGVPLEIDAKNDTYGLNTISQFNMQKDLSKDMFSDIVLAHDNGLNAELSIGYGNVTRDSGNKSNIKEYGWLGEYSFLSSWAANEKSVVSSIKSLEEITPDLKVEDVILFLTKMYDLPHSDDRLKNVETILNSMEKDKKGIQSEITEKDDTIVSFLYKNLYV